MGDSPTSRERERKGSCDVSTQMGRRAGTSAYNPKNLVHNPKNRTIPSWEKCSYPRTRHCGAITPTHKGTELLTGREKKKQNTPKLSLNLFTESLLHLEKLSHRHLSSFTFIFVRIIVRASLCSFERYYSRSESHSFNPLSWHDGTSRNGVSGKKSLLCPTACRRALSRFDE